jgi:hypothetical protein
MKALLFITSAIAISLISYSQPGGVKIGYDPNSRMIADKPGSLSIGNNSAGVISAGSGSLAGGYTMDVNDSIITSAVKNGAFAFGYTQGTGYIGALGTGSWAQGAAAVGFTPVDLGFSKILATGFGSGARGYSRGGSRIEASGPGAWVSGMASSFNIDSSVMEATLNGGHTFGCAELGGKMINNSAGGMIWGMAANGFGIPGQGMYSKATHGSFVMGYTIAGGRIESAGEGTLVGGRAQGDTMVGRYWNSLIWGNKLRDYADTAGIAVTFNRPGNYLYGYNIMNFGRGVSLHGSGFNNYADSNFIVGWGSHLFKIDGRAGFSEVYVNNKRILTTEDALTLTPQSATIGTGANQGNAWLTLASGTANTAAIKMEAGTLTTSPQNGNVEYDGTNYYATSGSTRYALAKTLTATAVLDFAITFGQTSNTMTINIPGAADGDAVTLGIPSAAMNANSNYMAYVSSADTVTIVFNNYSATPINPSAGTFRVSILKY